jgi:hypothetical protein
MVVPSFLDCILISYIIILILSSNIINYYFSGVKYFEKPFIPRYERAGGLRVLDEFELRTNSCRMILAEGTP